MWSVVSSTSHSTLHRKQSQGKQRLWICLQFHDPERKQRLETRSGSMWFKVLWQIRNSKWQMVVLTNVTKESPACHLNESVNIHDTQGQYLHLCPQGPHTRSLSSSILEGTGVDTDRVQLPKWSSFPSFSVQRPALAQWVHNPRQLATSPKTPADSSAVSDHICLSKWGIK